MPAELAGNRQRAWHIRRFHEAKAQPHARERLADRLDAHPLGGIDPSSFLLRDASGTSLPAGVRITNGGRTAILVPGSALTVATSYLVTLSAGIHDAAGNPLPATTWGVTTDPQVTFTSGTYSGYRFGPSSAHLTGLKRATVTAVSAAPATEYQVIDGQGFVLIAAGTWQGYWLHAQPTGQAIDDLRAPLITLPACDYVDLPAARSADEQSLTTVLDTVFTLPQDYLPSDLVDTSQAGLNAGELIRASSVPDPTELVAAARLSGVQLVAQSAYRSYASQVVTFNAWVASSGYAQALLIAARAGHSEHQLGLAIDFRALSGPFPENIPDWATTPEGAWMAANAWRYGWAMSYPKGSEAVSCYRYEPWHYRYVGRAAAAAIHDAGITPREWLWAQGYGIR